MTEIILLLMWWLLLHTIHSHTEYFVDAFDKNLRI